MWCVDVCAETGDIVTGASDNIVRVFSRDKKRWATEEQLKEFEDSVAKSSIPSNQVGDLNKEKLPGVEVLKNPGNKDGQVKMVRNGEVVEAYMWSLSTQSWASVGQVVDAVGSNRKRIYEGKEYDFVFDVDIQEGAPPLKLPYNASENPFEAARKFLEKNELPLSYLDTVGNFIVENSKGATIAQQVEPDTSTYDPWGSGSRYIPGQTSSSSRSMPTHAKVLPQKEYLSILTAKLPTVEEKARQFNDQLAQKGKTEIVMGEGDLRTLGALCAVLLDKNKSVSTAGVDLLSKLVRNWPPQLLIPVLDLLRLSAGVSPLVAKMDLVNLFHSTGTISQDSPNNAMLALRAFVNLFQTKEGRQYVMESFEPVCEHSLRRNVRQLIILDPCNGHYCECRWKPQPQNRSSYADAEVGESSFSYYSHSLMWWVFQLLCAHLQHEIRRHRSDPPQGSHQRRKYRNRFRDCLPLHCGHGHCSGPWGGGQRRCKHNFRCSRRHEECRFAGQRTKDRSAHQRN